MLEIQKFLSHHTLSQLTNEFGINVKEYDDRYILNYDQIKSSKFKTHKIVREARNLILNKKFEILHLSFERFFNYGENKEETENFDILNSTCFSKEDGSLIGIYHDNEKWCACTRKLAFAEGLCSSGIPFSKLIDEALSCFLEDYCIVNNFSKNYSYIFELVSPYTKVVKHYNFTGLFCLAVRNKENGLYENSELERIWSLKEIHKPRIFIFNSFEECIKSSKNLEKETDEGFVLVDKNNIRIKVKSPSYLAISKLHNNGQVTPKNILNLILECETDEFLSYFPEYRDLVNKYQIGINELRKDVMGIWNVVCDIENKKKFALQVKDLYCSGILFEMKGKNVEFNDAFSKLHIDTQLRYVERFI